MDYNYPSINKNIINELTSIFDELVIFRRKSNYMEEEICKFIKKHDGISEKLKTKIEEQEKKIDLIHTLFNIIKDSSQPNYDKIMSNLLNSDKIKFFDENLYDIKNIYESYNKLCINSNEIIEKTYNKLEEVNNNIINSNKTLEKYNMVFNEITKQQNEKIKKIELENKEIKERILLIENKDKVKNI